MEPLAIPAQQRVEFEGQQIFFPIFDATGEKDEPEAVGLRKRGLVELLTEQGILGDEIGFSAWQVGGGAENN